jgi:chemotaxis protein MotB
MESCRNFGGLWPFVIAVGVSACGVSQDLYNLRTTELDHCQNELGRMQGESTHVKQRVEELGLEANALRDRVATLESDRARITANLSATQQELEQLRRTHAVAEQRAELLRLLREKLAQPVAEQKLFLDVRQGRLAVRIVGEPLFDAGRAELKSAGQSLLRQVASILREIGDRDFIVASHTEPLSAKGSLFRSNWDLTAARAVVVVRFFQGEGVDPRHLAAAGYSEFATLPEVAGAHSEGTIEVLIMPTPDELPAT